MHYNKLVYTALRSNRNAWLKEAQEKKKTSLEEYVLCILSYVTDTSDTSTQAQKFDIYVTTRQFLRFDE